MLAEVISDRPEVFISYSRFRRDAAPGVRPGRAAGKRWLARKVAFDLMDVVIEAAARAGYQVWRDESSMTVGDQLGLTIDAALLSCAGAIVFLDPDALARSPWVRWESSILTWRQRIGMPVRVVPVLIEVGPEQLSRHGYGPSRLDQTLAHIVKLAGISPQSQGYGSWLDDHARQIVDELGKLEAEPAGPISVWIDRIALCLPEKSDRWRGALEQVIPRGERLRLSAYPDRVVARELLAADPASFQRIVNAFHGFSFADVKMFKFNLEPVWVPADAAIGMAAVKDRPPGKRIIAVNAVEAGTGADVVRRALPQAGHLQRLMWTIASATLEDAVADAKQQINGKWKNELARTVENLDGCFLMVSCGGSPVEFLAQLITELAAAYPSLTFVVMTGDSEPENYEKLDPCLPEAADEVGHTFDAELEDLLTVG